MQLKPLGERVVLKQQEAEEKTQSGIILPDSAKEKPQTAVVIAVGPGSEKNGKKTVAVVVPSPAMSFVLVATSFTSCAPIFS